MPNLADKGGLPSAIAAIVFWWLDDRFNFLGDFFAFDETCLFHNRHCALVEGTADILLPDSVCEVGIIDVT